MQGTLAIIIQLVCGAIGGNVAAAVKKNITLGTVGNTIAGIIGGGLGGQLLAMLGVGTGGTGSLDVSGIIGSIAGGGVGGGILMAIVGAIKQSMAKK
jgi:uncharacterized membrane protein YeaQ/YmgE (transglycosylase-associated protein family)